MDKLSNKSGPPSISCRQGLPIIKTFHHYFCQELRRCHGPNIHPWDPGPNWSTIHGGGEHPKESLRRPPLWPPPLETSKGAPAQVEAQTDSTSSLIRSQKTVSTKIDAHVAYGVGFGRSYGKIISRRFQIHPESTGIVRGI